MKNVFITCRGPGTYFITHCNGAYKILHFISPCRLLKTFIIWLICHMSNHCEFTKAFDRVSHWSHINVHGLDLIILFGDWFCSKGPLQKSLQAWRVVQPCGAQVGPSGCATGTEIISLKRTVALFQPCYYWHLSVYWSAIGILSRC